MRRLFTNKQTGSVSVAGGIGGHPGQLWRFCLIGYFWHFSGIRLWEWNVGVLGAASELPREVEGVVLGFWRGGAASHDLRGHHSGCFVEYLRSQDRSFYTNWYTILHIETSPIVLRLTSGSKRRPSQRGMTVYDFPASFWGYRILGQIHPFSCWFCGFWMA